MDNKEIKKLIYQIANEEIKERSLKVGVLPLTSLENIIDIILTPLKSHPKNLKDLIFILRDTKNYLQANKNLDAYYDFESNELKILIKNHTKQEEAHFIWNLIKRIYHEYHHVILEKTFKKAYIETKEDVYYSIENLLNPLDEFYLTYHDDLYIEILANNYGFKKAYKFLKENKQYTQIYKKLENTIELDKILREIYHRNYDIQLLLSKINKDIKENIKALNCYLDEKELQIINLLYTKTGRFKSLKELSNTINWNNLDIEARYLIVSSEAYLTDIDYQNLSKEELYFILDALSYSLTIEYERPKYNQEFRTTIESISRKLTDEDIGALNIYLDAILMLNTKEKANQIKIEKLQTMINTITALINKKNNYSNPKKKLLLNH